MLSPSQKSLNHLLLKRPEVRSQQLPKRLISNPLSVDGTQSQHHYQSQQIERKSYRIFNQTSESKRQVFYRNPLDFRNFHANTENRSPEVIFKNKVEKAFASISDPKNKTQIIKAIKDLRNAKERVSLIDKVLKRKDEINKMQEKMTYIKLRPIFQILAKKFNKKRKSDDASKKSVHDQDDINHKVIKLQQKETTQTAIKWLYKRDKTENIDEKIIGLEHKFQKESISNQKVSERSKQLMEQGKKLEWSPFKHQIKLRNNLKLVSARINTMQNANNQREIATERRKESLIQWTKNAQIEQKNNNKQIIALEFRQSNLNE